MNIIKCHCGDTNCFAVFDGYNFYEEGLSIIDNKIFKWWDHNYNEEENKNIINYFYKYYFTKNYLLYPTSDIWFSNYPKGMVAVSPILKLSNGKWRICVWGTDDFGMSRDFDEYDVALQYGRKIPFIISIKSLEDMGLNRE